MSDLHGNFFLSNNVLPTNSTCKQTNYNFVFCSLILIVVCLYTFKIDSNFLHFTHFLLQKFVTMATIAPYLPIYVALWLFTSIHIYIYICISVCNCTTNKD